MPFGEPTVFPGGISYGTIIVDAQRPRSRPTGVDDDDRGRSTCCSARATTTSRSRARWCPAPTTTRTAALGSVAVHGGITTVHGGGNSRLEVRGDFTATPTTITRTDGVSWASAGFAVGQLVTLDGTRRRHDHRRLSGATLTRHRRHLRRGAVTDTIVAVRDPKTRRDADRRRHDHRSPAARGPNSPLVVYGDTSQDGRWYSGDPRAPVDRRLRHEAVPDRGRQRHAALLLPAREPVPLRRQRRRSTRSALFAGVAAGALPARRLHRLRRRRRRPDHRQPGRRLPRGRLGRRRRSSAGAASTRSTATTASTST